MITAYPNGVSSFGVPVMPSTLPVLTTGSVFFVHAGPAWMRARPARHRSIPSKRSTTPSANARPPGRCDLRHAGAHYTITAAGTITLDVAGVSRRLGPGHLRPIITYTTAAAGTFAVSAANCKVQNIIFNANYADIVAAVVVTGKDFTLEGCLFKEQATNMNFLTCVATGAVANGADGLSVIRCERISIDAAALAFVSILEACSRLSLIGNFDNQSSAADVGHFLIQGAFDVLGAKIIGNILQLNGDNNAQAVGVFATGSSTASTGVMAYNLVGSLDTTTELIVTATLDYQEIENYYTGTIAKSGKLWPAADAA